MVLTTLGNTTRAKFATSVANAERSEDFFVLWRSMLAGRGQKSSALEYAAKFGASERARDILESGVLHGMLRKDNPYDPLTTSDTGTAAGDASLTPYQSVANGFIQSLQPWSSFDTLAAVPNGFRKFPMRVRLALTTATAVGSQVDETNLKPMTSIETDSVQLDPVKCIAFLTCSNELARFAGPEAMALLRYELSAACGNAVDSVFLNAITNTAGIRTAASSGLSATAFVSDVKDALESLELDSTSKVALVAPPSVVNDVALMQGTNGQLLFPGVKVGSGGDVQGIFLTPSNSLTDSMVMMDLRQVAISDSLPIIDATSDACLIFDTDPADNPTLVKSLWQRNEVGVRVERWMSSVLIDTTGAAVISDVGEVTA